MCNDFDVPTGAEPSSDDGAAQYGGNEAEWPSSPASKDSGRSCQAGVPIPAEPASPAPTYRRSLFRR